MLERLVGAGLPVPQLEARGEVAGWPYVVMSRLPGRRVPRNGRGSMPTRASGWRTTSARRWRISPRCP